jgi:hypothetical protein
MPAPWKASASVCLGTQTRFAKPHHGVLALPCLLLQFFVNEMTYPQGGQDGKPKRGYQASPEDTYYNLAQYYDIPTISFRWDLLSWPVVSPRIALWVVRLC